MAVNFAPDTIPTCRGRVTYFPGTVLARLSEPLLYEYLGYQNGPGVGYLRGKSHATCLYSTSIAQSGAARTIVVDVGVAPYSHPRGPMLTTTKCCMVFSNQQTHIATWVLRRFATSYDVFATSQIRRRPLHRDVASQKNEV